MPAFEVEASDAHVDIHNNQFGQVRSVRVTTGGCVCLCGDREDVATVATFVDRLCPAGLQAAELCAEDCVGPGDMVFFLNNVVRTMISRHGDRFAVEVVTAEHRYDDLYWDKMMLRRLAWRRWPPPGAPDLQAAQDAHERARAWAATRGQDDEDEDGDGDIYGEGSDDDASD